MRNYLKVLLAILSMTIIMQSCKKDIAEESATTSFRTVEKYDYNVVFEWNNLWMDIERYASGYRPCPTANALGYIGLASYEACISGMPENASLSSLYNGLNIPKAFNNQEYHWPTVINAVNEYLYSRLLPEVEVSLYSKIKVLADKNEKDFLEQVGQEVFIRSKNHGESVAAAVWDWMKNDEYFEFRIEKSPVTNETILTITDFADKKEIGDQELLWDAQIHDLKHRIGS